MTRFRPLPRTFYEPSAQIVAQSLLGHLLVRNLPQGICGGTIVETEAYLIDDPACHAFPGITARTRVMFGEPGHAYVYFIYGCHFCVNAVCRPAGVAEAVLIRAIEPLLGQDILQQHRPAANLRNLTNGPAKLCQAMNIDRGLDGVDLCSSDSALFVARNREHAAFLKAHGPVIASARIGISQAICAPLRFFLLGSSYVSGSKAANKAADWVLNHFKNLSLTCSSPELTGKSGVQFTSELEDPKKC